jgi:hypothetical protein
MHGVNANQVQGNFVGTEVAGASALGNGGHGLRVSISSGTLIGGSTGDSGNVISGNTGAGIYFFYSYGDNDRVEGNLIGTGADGTSPLGNLLDGIRLLGASGKTVGGATVSQGNRIAFNGGAGITVRNFNPSLYSWNDQIRENSIFSNGGLGIDLSEDGVTLNDGLDIDVGANRLQNYPVLTAAATLGANTIVNGSLNSLPNSQFALDFFSSSSCDPSGYGEGESFIGSTNVTTDGSGNAPLSITLPTLVPPGQYVTATATSLGGFAPDMYNTSEFSNCVSVDADADGDGCSDGRELQTAADSELSGGLRDPLNPYDYFNPTNDGTVRVDDILAVVGRYFSSGDPTAPINQIPPAPPAYHAKFDRAPLGPNVWNLMQGNGFIGIPDILAVIGQYFHDCGTGIVKV